MNDLDLRITNIEKFANEILDKSNKGLSANEQKAVDSIVMMIPFCHDEESASSEQKSTLEAILKRIYPLSSFAQKNEENYEIN